MSAILALSTLHIASHSLSVLSAGTAQGSININGGNSLLLRANRLAQTTTECARPLTTLQTVDYTLVYNVYSCPLMVCLEWG